MLIPPGAVSQSVDISIVDDTGLPVTGLVAATFPTTTYSIAGANADVGITLADLALITTAYASGGVKERGNGVYRLDLPNAAVAAAGRVRVRGEATNKRLLCGIIDVQHASANVAQLLGTAWLAPGTAGTPDVNAKLWNALATVALPLIPTVAGRTLDVSATGEAGLDWANVGSPTTALALTGTTISSAQKVDIETIKTNPVVNAGTITFPTTATLASTTNITAGTITTASNLTTNNDKTGYGLSAAAVQAIWDALTSALTTAGSIGKKLADWVLGTTQTGDSFARLGAPAGASVSADIAAAKADTAAIKAKTDNLPAAPASTTNITAGTMTTTTNLTNLPAITANWLTAAGIADGAIDRATFAADTGLQTIRSNTAQTGAISSITLDAAASATSETYTGEIIRITAGTGADQVRVIRTYNGTTKVALITPDWTTAPDVTSSFAILPSGPANTVMLGGVAQTALDVGLAVGTDIPATLNTIKAKTNLLPAAPASTTNITAGTMTTTTNLTTNNDKTGYALTSGERDAVAAALLALANGIETGVSPKQAIQRMMAALAGNNSADGSIYYAPDGTTVRQTVTQVGASGRSVVNTP